MYVTILSGTLTVGGKFGGGAGTLRMKLVDPFPNSFVEGYSSSPANNQVIVHGPSSDLSVNERVAILKDPLSVVAVTVLVMLSLVAVMRTVFPSKNNSLDKVH